MNTMKFIRTFLLVLIIIGIGLLATQKYWVPKVVDEVVHYQDKGCSCFGNSAHMCTYTVSCNSKVMY